MHVRGISILPVAEDPLAYFRGAKVALTPLSERTPPPVLTLKLRHPFCLSGVVLCSLKTIRNKRLQVGDQRVKTSRVDSHIACTSAGLTADAMVLVKDCRVSGRVDFPQ